jgi:hypothetical protein
MIAWLSEHVGRLSTARSKLEGDEWMAGDGWKLTYIGPKPMLSIEEENAALLFKLTWL